MLVATGEAIERVLDAVRIRLQADATLAGLVTGIYGHVPGAARVAYPYLRLAEPVLADDYGAMGGFGGILRFAVDVWSGARGAHDVRQILARVLVLLERVDLIVPGHFLAAGSLHCEETRVFDEPDPDMPDQGLYHGHQTWQVLIEEV